MIPDPPVHGHAFQNGEENPSHRNPFVVEDDRLIRLIEEIAGDFALAFNSLREQITLLQQQVEGARDENNNMLRDVRRRSEDLLALVEDRQEEVLERMAEVENKIVEVNERLAKADLLREAYGDEGSEGEAIPEEVNSFRILILGIAILVVLIAHLLEWLSNYNTFV
ncbi:hypothetical protein QAD02_013534 [Eretmocerus hayati]|uniref:Uncharacterized protein n=1 Tax=Eretmocerus hayati TaxID=131215 RepID=A0ACC2P2Z5_9HYME|nr:hypothetical protein QAD02_013534 [Eretmocerus hayati]